MISSRANSLAQDVCARTLLVAGLLGFTSGCAQFDLQQVSKDEAPVMMGPAVRTNRTPLEPAFACMADQIQKGSKPRLTIGVGDVRDYTGKYSINEGNAITQGGSLMVYSALGKLGNSVRVAERFDTRITEMELGYIDRRQLGDGRAHPVDPTKRQVVPWLPYFGGTIMRSNYYLVGGITELNHNIQSGGASAEWTQLGPRARVFTSSVGIDLRLVDSQSLVVIRSISLQKQITGIEVGFNVFRFFGNSLWDINVGNKSQEPLQLAVRTSLEEAVLRLVGTATGVDEEVCLEHVPYRIAEQSAPAIRRSAAASTGAVLQEEAPEKLVAEPVAHTSPALVSATPPTEDSPPPPGLVPRNAAQATAPTKPLQQQSSVRQAPEGTEFEITFNFGSSTFDGATASMMDRVAASARKAKVQISILTPVTENLDPAKRRELLTQRMTTVARALAQRGVSPASMSLAWAPPPNSPAITPARSGFQLIAKISVGGAV